MAMIAISIKKGAMVVGQCKSTKKVSVRMMDRRKKIMIV
jgi:hypothetical protein